MRSPEAGLAGSSEHAANEKASASEAKDNAFIVSLQESRSNVLSHGWNT
jgi:hypothetical protein